MQEHIAQPKVSEKDTYSAEDLQSTKLLAKGLSGYFNKTTRKVLGNTAGYNGENIRFAMSATVAYMNVLQTLTEIAVKAPDISFEDRKTSVDFVIEQLGIIQSTILESVAKDTKKSSFNTCTAYAVPMLEDINNRLIEARRQKRTLSL